MFKQPQFCVNEPTAICIVIPIPTSIAVFMPALVVMTVTIYPKSWWKFIFLLQQLIMTSTAG